MFHNLPVISLVIATLNSEEKLPRCLDSIKKQTYNQKNIEILVVDGGSIDKTQEIAKKYNCRIISNPKVVPTWAKYIGFLEARGDYALFIDSDEVVENENSFRLKLEVFKENPNVHAVTGSGYKNPIGYSALNNYISEFGDPFSFFIYRLSKDYKYYISSMKKDYSVTKETKNYIVFNFSSVHKLPIFELVAMSSMVDLVYLKKNFPETKYNSGLIPHLFNLLISKGSYIGITKNDVVTHYSSESVNKYYGKIISRIKNNIFSPAIEGFRGRDRYETSLGKLKKYLFIPYAFTLIFPLIDSIYLAVTRKNLGYFNHVFLTIYTAFQISRFYLLKLFGKTPELKSYGESMKVKS
jgi:glycosyltransferase involved in cell wall biosynthesis